MGKGTLISKFMLTALILVSGTSLGLISPVSATTFCTPVTPTDAKFGSLITAAKVAITGQTITGDVDATGCDAGVYIGPGVTGVTVTAAVHDASQVNIFNDGGTVTVTGSTVTNVGAHTGTAFTPNGVQTGIGVYFSCGGTGIISSNTINQYQKGGITVRDLDGVTVTGNTVTGLGVVNFIAQNGIEFGFGTCGPTVSTSNVGQVTGNTVTDNQYNGNGGRAPPPFISTGILAQATSGTKVGPIQSALVTSNTVFRNQGNVVVIVG